MYNHLPKAFVMKICGLEWEMGNTVTEQAKENLEKAFEFFKGKINIELKD